MRALLIGALQIAGDHTRRIATPHGATARRNRGLSDG
jgi:hypothetical protein